MKPLRLCLLLAAGAAAVLAGCDPGDDEIGAGAEPLVEDPQHPPGVPPAPNPPYGDVVGPGGITPPMLALGDSIFHGLVGGAVCVTCHGTDAKGTTLGPDLTDRTWLNADGTYQSIVNVVTLGVQNPKRYPAAMPPMGGSALTPEQVKAVAAYVYSLNVPGGASGGEPR